MRQVCKVCGKEFKDGDRVKALVLSVYRQISSSVAYAIEMPYECLSLQHVACSDTPEE